MELIKLKGESNQIAVITKEIEKLGGAYKDVQRGGTPGILPAAAQRSEGAGYH